MTGDGTVEGAVKKRKRKRRRKRKHVISDQ